MASGPAIVLFDGTCAFCEGSVKFIARRDPTGYFRFGASQSPSGVALLAQHGLSRESTRSIVLVEDGTGVRQVDGDPSDRPAIAVSVVAGRRIVDRAAAAARRRVRGRRGDSPSTRRYIECL